jgi:hypothetical protein
MGPMNTPTLIFSILTLGKFSHKNKMLGHFCPVPYDIFHEAKFNTQRWKQHYMDLQDADKLCSLFQVSVIYVVASYSSCSEHF